MTQKIKIPPRTHFDALPKEKKVELIKELRREYDDKTIRDAWKFSAGGYYQLLYRHGLADAKKREDGANKGGRPSATKETKETIEEEIRENVPSDANWPKRNIVEAEFVIVSEHKPEEPKQEEEKQSMSPAIIPPPAEKVDLPFPAIKGTPAQLRKTFDAVVMFLEAQESEDTRFEIRLSVVKA